MGGFGSGRRFGKDCTDGMQALDVRKLQRQRLLTPGNSLSWAWSCNGATTATINLIVGADRVTLNYRTRERGGDWRPMNYPVRLDWTGCNYGGRRAWWRCPAAGCSRRVAVLYGGAVFACRHCHRLAYRCQREADDDRAARRANVIRQRLGWEPGILNGSGLKPKGMHWRTFERLHAEHDAHVGAALAGIVARLGWLRGRSGGIDLGPV
ncbi:MAG: hypothetical protein IT500_16605 [Rubrivivax sp.]|nr:hypothetical protein [Rubrivivax sp.]